MDDGSGYLMDLVVWKGEPPTGRKPKFSFDDLKEVSLHSIIKAKGSLGEFRGNKQLLLRRIAVLHDTNDEVDAWTETIKFKKNVLSKPWHLTEEFINEERAIEEEEGRKEKKRRKDEQTLRRKEKELEKAAREKKRKGKVVEESARGNHVGAEVAATEVGYRGRRRLTGPEKSEPLLPVREPLDDSTSQREETSQPPAPESIYRGRRRQSPSPWPPSVSPDLKLADGSAPILAQASRLSKLQPLNTHCSEPDEYGQEPSYKRRRYSPPTLELGLQPSSQRSEILESSFRGCRRSSRAPLQLTASNIALLENSTSEFLVGVQSQPSAGAGSYVGRRRTRSESASINQGLRDNHPLSKLETIPSSPPRVVRRSRSSRYSPRELRVPRTDAPRDTSPGADFPQPMPERVPSSIESLTSIYRGRRRRAGSETASVIDPTTVPTINRTKLETVEPSPPLSVLVECPSESSYRGRRRRGETATSSQPSRGSSIFLNPVEEKSDCGRWTGSTVPKDPALPPSFPPGDGDGSRYRGRRRAQIS